MLKSTQIRCKPAVKLPGFPGAQFSLLKKKKKREREIIMVVVKKKKKVKVCPVSSTGLVF